MKAAIVRAAGEAPVYGDFEEPACSTGEHRVTVTAAAISHVVKGRAAGTHYSATGQFPFIVGIDGVGRLEDGRRVYFLMPNAPYGSMAERAVVPASRCLALPDDLDDLTAAAIANPGMSSWAAYTQRAKLAAGETVLVNGATGTSGRLAVSIARHLGAKKIIAVARNAEALASVGADVAISLSQSEAAVTDDLKAQLSAGVDVVIDYLWGQSAERILRLAAAATPAGAPMRFVQVGAASGADIALPGAVLRSSAITLMGSGIGSVSPKGLLGSIDAVLQAAGPAGFKIAYKATPLSEVERAWSEDDSQRRTVFTLTDRVRNAP